MMLQQEKPEDFVIATGKQMSVREFVRLSAREAGIEVEFRDEGVNEYAVIANMIDTRKAPSVSVGDVIVRVDERYFRPAEVETLLGDPSKAKAKLGWECEITVEEMCAEMVATDLELARKHALLRRHGHTVNVAKE